ncbi:MAG: Lar family restriction alleviation protein [Oscillospiraceae bacterium]|nr:Lar family restriction alleviation protein [Oscillospiraceae bacterium]
MTEQLKLCPFCGSDAIKLWHSPFGVGGECQICGANSGHANFNGETKQQAAAAWNKRVPEKEDKP